MLYRIKSFFNPEYFQGWGKKKKYFEGWYYKVLNQDCSEAFAFIPGIATDESGSSHAFIQVLDGKRKTSEYHRYDAADFHPSKNKLDIRLGNSHFTETGFFIDIPGSKGEIMFQENVPWPKPVYSPGIMGPYAFVPFMECYHGIVSMNHQLTGNMQRNGKQILFDGGKGYTEKDWGRSFPEAYIWMQSNHFQNPNVSLKASVAKIPWIRNSFVGFIAGLWLNGRLIRFTTYNSSKLVKCQADLDTVEIILENRKLVLHIRAIRDKATSLASPIHGMMNGRIEESMSAKLNVQLIEKRSGTILFNDTGYHTGLEVAGKISEIVTN